MNRFSSRGRLVGLGSKTAKTSVHVAMLNVWACRRHVTVVSVLMWESTSHIPHAALNKKVVINYFLCCFSAQIAALSCS